MSNYYELKSNTFSLELSSDFFHIESSEKLLILSSAVLNGGFYKANHILNLRVPKGGGEANSPQDALIDVCLSHGWGKYCVGMMTAASMKSMAIKEKVSENTYIAICLTVGLSNTRTAGDKADIQKLFSDDYHNGTINIALITDAELTLPAMTEALMIITEAKCEAMRRRGVKSPISNRVATGTGTDSVVVAAAGKKGRIQYAGKHTLFGQIIANLVIEALFDSMKWYQDRKEFSHIIK